MKIFRWIIIVWTICITLLFGLAVNVRQTKPITETRTFCAYGRLFVEFEDRERVWGTLMLDFYGKPIPCIEGIETEVNNTI